MATLTDPRPTSAGPTEPCPTSARPTSAGLDLSRLGPNWYAGVMGTAIVANGAAALPLNLPGLIGFGELVWGLAVLALAVLVAARVVHLARHRAAARTHLLDDPATAVFYGCPPMALLATGYATLMLGGRVIGTGPAVAVDMVLWTVGTLYAVAVAVGIPYLMITRHQVPALHANPTWLLPVVAPVVAAALGPALVPHLPGALQATMVYGCGALLGGGLLFTLLLLPIVLGGLLHGKPPTAALAPALFLVLGPLGQSTTAVNQLADAARTVAPRLADGGTVFAVLYGVTVMGFAMVWLLVALVANLRARRSGMPFAMTWWAYTFPVGTLVTGAAALARHTGFVGFTVLATALYVLLLTAWAVAGTRTVHGLVAGRLL